MRERLRQEDGVALLLALAFTIALSLLVFGMTSYVTSNQKSAQNDNTDGQARGYAEAALDTAYSRIQYANSSAGTLAGINPAKPSLLGCGTGANGASDCSTVNPLCVSFTATCPNSGSYTTTAGTGVVSGFYTGTGSGSYAGLTEPSSTWILTATGYAVNSSGQIDAKSLRATVTISAANSGAVASVWNHVFLTAPKVTGVCQTTFAANGTTLDSPIYTMGNLCFLGNTVGLAESANGQHIDLQVGGILYYGGNGDFVGSSTTPITSGVVVGGCATTLTQFNSGSAPACTNGSSPSYHTGSNETYISQNDPELTNTQIESNYATFDPGPKHGCLAGTTPSPLNANQFDFNVGGTEGSSTVPDNSGSGSNGGVFDLTPSSSYACISTSGTGTGYLIWNNGASSLTVSGITVPSKTLAINGSVFIDAPLQVSQSMTYQGTGIVMVAGQITFPANSETICAINTGCSYTNWQGSSGHNDMLTLATVLKNSSTAISWTGNGITYQGSLWCSPTSTLSITGQGVPNVQGPMSVGSLTVSGNSFTLNPLPVIKNMPVGAPVPPNVSATISPLSVIG